MKSPCPVADVLRDFEKLELGYMETLRDCIEGRADKLKYGALFEQNNDFVGWISIDETSIHYGCGAPEKGSYVHGRVL